SGRTRSQCTASKASAMTWNIASSPGRRHDCDPVRQPLLILSSAMIAGACTGSKGMTERELLFDPATLDFGERPLGTLTELKTSLQNTGVSRLSLTTFRFDPSIDAFTAHRGDGGPLAGTPLPPGDSVVLSIQFAPQVDGKASTTLIVVLGDIEKH